MMKSNEFAYMSEKFGLRVKCSRARGENKYYTQTAENAFTKSILITLVIYD